VDPSGNTAWRGWYGSTAHVGKTLRSEIGAKIGAEMDDFEGKIGWISWIEIGET